MLVSTQLVCPAQHCLLNVQWCFAKPRAQAHPATDPIALPSMTLVPMMAPQQNLRGSPSFQIQVACRTSITYFCFVPGRLFGLINSGESIKGKATLHCRDCCIISAVVGMNCTCINLKSLYDCLGQVCQVLLRNVSGQGQ